MSGRVNTGETFLNIDFEVIRYKNGIYQGLFNDRLRCGPGVFIWDNGQIYIGNWEKDEMNGFGLVYFYAGGSYIGNFKNSKANGTGIYKTPESNIYSGEWIEGKPLNPISFFDFYHQEWKIIEYNFSRISVCKPDKKTSKMFGFLPFNENLNRIEQLGHMSKMVNLKKSGARKDSIKAIKELVMGEKTSYVGFVDFNIPNGLGIYLQDDQYFKRGEFRSGNLSGFGSVFNKDNEFYTGIFDNDRIIQGFHYNLNENSYYETKAINSEANETKNIGKGFPYHLLGNSNVIQTNNKAYTLPLSNSTQSIPI